MIIYQMEAFNFSRKNYMLPLKPEPTHLLTQPSKCLLSIPVKSAQTTKFGYFCVSCKARCQQWGILSGATPISSIRGSILYLTSYDILISLSGLWILNLVVGTKQMKTRTKGIKFDCKIVIISTISWVHYYIKCFFYNDLTFSQSKGIQVCWPIVSRLCLVVVGVDKMPL